MAETPVNLAQRAVSGRQRPPTVRETSYDRSPSTPLFSRSISSPFSPGGGHKPEDDYFILEFGSRIFRAGTSGERTPACTVAFGPDESRRVGDYRQWMPGYKGAGHPDYEQEYWSKPYELWNLDIRQNDMGLVEDKLERMVRKAFSQYLLHSTESKARRVALPIQPTLPHPLLSAVLCVLFTQTATVQVTLFSSPILSTIAAGLRSSLVVDIGWEETVVTAVYEYREINTRRSVRAGKMLHRKMAQVIEAALAFAETLKEGAFETDEEAHVTFEEVEEVVMRLAWCRNGNDSSTSSEDIEADLVEVPLSGGTFKQPFGRFADAAEASWFSDESSQQSDIHEECLHLLVYRALLSLPPDVRGLCMSRIVVTGGGSCVPGVKSRLQAELNALIGKRGWSPVNSYGSVTPKRDRDVAKRDSNNTVTSHTSTEGSRKTSERTDVSRPASTTSQVVPASQAQPERDPIEYAMERRTGNPIAKPVQGVVRLVETLGPWAGASLVTSMRVKGVVEIEKERFLQYGLAGASREKDVSVVPQRQSLGAGTKSGDRSSWTLGVWA